MSASLAPIVLFVYNRPDHTRRTIEALVKNTGARESELFIYSDAPKNASAEASVMAVRTYLKAISGFKQVTITERERNWGLADSIVDGVSTIVNQYGKVVVLEDDIVTSPHFLTYMNQALALYEHDDRVMHVSGYFHPVDPKGLPDTFFYNQASCWGWGTWKRAWQTYNGDTSALYTQLRTKPIAHEYYVACLSQLRGNLRGSITTWAAKWQASILLHRGLCLHPAHSYVTNIGHDGSGIHSERNASFSVVPEELNQTPTLNKVPDFTEHQEAAQRADTFMRTLRPSLLKRVTKRILWYVK